MNYIPTESEAESMWFKFWELYWELDLWWDFKIQMVEWANTWLIYKPSWFGNCLHFSSKKDIETLIRILTI